MNIAHGMEQSLHLPLAGADDARIGMAGCGDPES